MSLAGLLRPSTKPIWSCRFRTPQEIAKLGGVITGSPVFTGDGIELDGVNDYVAFPVAAEFTRALLSVKVVFTPYTAYDGTSVTLVAATNDAIRIYHTGSASVNVERADTLLNTGAVTTSTWAQNERNTIIGSPESGANAAWANGQSLFTSAVTFSPNNASPRFLYAGAHNDGSLKFEGVIHEVSLFDLKWTTEEVSDDYNNATFHIPEPVLELNMESATVDPTGTYQVTPDRKGHLVTLGDGLGTGAPTFENPGFSFDGSDDYLGLPEATGESTVIAKVDNQVYVDGHLQRYYHLIKTGGFLEGELDFLARWDKELTPTQLRYISGKHGGNVESRNEQGFFHFKTTDTTQDWTVIRVGSGIEYSINWGDGIVDSYTGNGTNQNLTHNYAGAGTYTITFSIDDPTALEYFYAYNNQLTGSIPDLSNNTALVRFYVYTNQLTGSIPDLSNNTALQYFRGQNNQLTGSIPDLSNNTALEYLWVQNNQLTGSIPDLSNNTALEYLWVYTNQLTGYTASTISTTLTEFNASDNALSLAAVDQILTDFTTGAGARPAAGTIDISGGTNATPTPATKAACVAALPGWAIHTN